MSDSEKIATLLSQVRQLESDCRMKDEALRHEIEITEDAWKRWTEKDQNNPENRGWKLHWSARLAALEQYQKKAALSPTPQPDAAPADTVSMPKSTYLYLRGALSMLPEDALGFGNYADPQHGQPAQYPILRELQDRVDQLLPSTASPLTGRRCNRGGGRSDL